MKKLISKDFTIDPAKLFIPIAQTLEHLQEAYSESIDALILSVLNGALTGGFITNGVVDTVSGGVNHSISAGNVWLFLNASAWSNATAYSQYDLTSKNGNEYISLVAGTNTNTNHDPETSPTFWARVGVHQTGQVFAVDAVVLNALANAVVGKIVPTYASTDPTAFTDGSTANVHVIYKLVFIDAVSGTGVVDYKNLFGKWNVVGATDQPAFENSWVNDNTTTENSASFKKTNDGFVQLRGSISTGASNTTAFTLPSAYRPLKLNYFICAVAGDTAKIAIVAISSAGIVNVKYVAGAGVISLDGIRFALD